MSMHRIEAIPMVTFGAGPPEDPDLPSGPLIAPWRNNLTALSQEYNLYFVAYQHLLYVYEPGREIEELGISPVQIIFSKPVNLGQRGYLDRRNPHAINNLLVAKLGTEEVLACVRDDGDCDVFMVRHVLDAIADYHATEFKAREPSMLMFERPIFQFNVGLSAWGLAIHSEARMLAVSSNHHEITVRKFALVDDQGADRSMSNAEHTRANAGESRYETVEQVFQARANIPHIAFCNTGDDPQGRWLAATDISGNCIFLDLHLNKAVQAVRFGQSFAEPGVDGYDRINAGWGIMFLDRRAFDLESSKRRALGLAPGEQLPDEKTDPTIWDLTSTIQSLPDTADRFVEWEETEWMDIDSGRASVSHVPDQDDMTRSAIESSRTGTPAHEELIIGRDGGGMGSQTANAAQDEANTSSADSTTDDNIADDEAGQVEATNDPEPITFNNGADLYDDVEDEQTEDSVGPAMLYGGNRICGNKPRFAVPTGICSDLPCPVLHTSLRNLYLLQPSSWKKQQPEGYLFPPVVGFARPLRQLVQAENRGLNLIDRMNMHAYIPSLGVVIVASQKGRAIVLALTKVKIDMQTVYAMRAECILPFAKEEQAPSDTTDALRPFAPLHGIAVGPMPGTEGLRDEEKRWRLFMMYQDREHSVLTYEIRRKKGQDAGVADVIV